MCVADALRESGTANETTSLELINSVIRGAPPHAVDLHVFRFPVISLIVSGLIQEAGRMIGRENFSGFSLLLTWHGTLYLTIPIGKSSPAQPPHVYTCKRFSVSVAHVHFHFRLHGALTFTFRVSRPARRRPVMPKSLILLSFMTNGCDAITYVVGSFHSFRRVGRVLSSSNQ
jgi:hypothetical protein